jgi:hypothetical protein
MADTYVGSEADRLPWLSDDAGRPRRSSSWVVAFVAAATVAIIAALSFWLGMNGLPRGLSLPIAQDAPDVRIGVPPAEPEAAVRERVMPEVQPSPVPGPVALPMEGEVRPSAAVAPPVRRVMRDRVSVHRSRPARAKAASSTKEKAEPEKKSLEFTNPWESAGASGKMVRVGTYSSLSQGKQAWSRLARVYPAIKRMPAVVTDIPSLRNGRTYYRLQIGTTSQAHSEVLCQRMRTIGQSCVVVDLDGARKGSMDDGQPVGL